jgi:hypothetical protein
MEFPYIYPPLFIGRAKQPSPYIPVLLEYKGNGQYIEGLVDSGADVSAIAESLAWILDIPLDGPETTLNCLGSEMKGRSAQVELTVENGSVRYSTNEVFS